VVTNARQHQSTTAKNSALVAQPNVIKLANNIRQRLTRFDYDAQTDKTFLKWYTRNKFLLEEEGLPLDDKVRARLMLESLESKEYDRLTAKLLPKSPDTLTYAETIMQLTTQFSSTKSKFQRRLETLSIVHAPGADIGEYGEKVRAAIAESELDKLTLKNLECLIFVTGLRSKEDTQLRSIAVKELVETPTVTLPDLITKCQLFYSRKKDEQLIANPAPSIVNMTKSNNKGKSKFNKPKIQEAQTSTGHSSIATNKSTKICNYCNKHGHVETEY